MSDSIPKLKVWLRKQQRIAVHNRKFFGAHDYEDSAYHNGEASAYRACLKKLEELEGEGNG
jgi:hypothetical protein